MPGILINLNFCVGPPAAPAVLSIYVFDSLQTCAFFLVVFPPSFLCYCWLTFGVCRKLCLLEYLMLG